MGILDRFRLDGRRALVTGGSRGLGRAIATALAEAGADLIVVARESKSLEQTAGEIRTLGRSCVAIAADVGDPKIWEPAVGKIANEHGPIDILVNNVGGRRIPTPTHELPLSDWQKIIDLNLTSAFIATRTVGAAMIERGRGGRIINIASISGMIANRGIGGRSYETAKAALIQFTRTLAADWAPHKITANAICPGGFMTEANERWARENPAVIEGFRAQIPAGDFGDPQDLGPLAVYLASDAARYVTGAAIIIDGGYTVW
jgi:gluconate 5-dehydrogenase